MAAVDVLNFEGVKVGEAQLSDAIFGATVNESLLWEAVVAQRAAKRAGTHSTKTRGEVRGSTRKIYKQKGTGKARHGGIRANIFVGGGVVFGPKPRSYAYALPKKVRRGALISALSLRAEQKKLILLKDIELPDIKTKAFAAILDKLGAANSLVVDARTNVKLEKSVRNLAKAKYIAPEGLNVYDLLNHDTLIMTVPVAKALEERLSK